MKKTNIFSDEEINRIYEESWDKWPQASQETVAAYDNIHDALEEYLNSIQSDMFRFAYQYGYNAALAKTGKGGAA